MWLLGQHVVQYQSWVNQRECRFALITGISCRLTSSPRLSLCIFLWQEVDVCFVQTAMLIRSTIQQWIFTTTKRKALKSRQLSCSHATRGTMQGFFFFWPEWGDVFLPRWHHGPSPEERGQAAEDAARMWRAEHGTSGPQHLHPPVPDKHRSADPSH